MFCAITETATVNRKRSPGSKLDKYFYAYRKPQFLSTWKIMYSLVMASYRRCNTAKRDEHDKKVVVLSVKKKLFKIRGHITEAYKTIAFLRRGKNTFVHFIPLHNGTIIN